MKTIHTINAMRAWSADQRAAGRTIALAPTMGFLHEGHLSLIRLAREKADAVCVSIYVNPTQFGPNEDFEAYPRDAKGDEKKCREEGVEAVFYPSNDVMYASDHSVYVDETALSRTLCGASRPGHFRGVCTVVAKLFHIVQPDIAVFGEKDFQQWRIIRRMARDLNWPVELVPCPIVREPDGLAMSSRNARLAPDHRAQAACLHRALEQVRDMARGGERNADRLRRVLRKTIERAPDARIDYAEIVSEDTLQPVHVLDGPCRAALAVFFGDVRLIDNAALIEAMLKG